MRLEQLRGSVRTLPTPAVDVAVAAGLAIVITTLIAARLESGAKDPDALAFVLGVAIAALLLVRRRWPLTVFLVSVLLLIAYHALDYPAIGLAVPLAPAIYIAAQAGHVWAVVVAVVGLEAWALGWRALGEGDGLVKSVGAQTLFEAALVAAVLLLVEAVRSRRALVAEAAERLRLAEAERERETERRVEQERFRIAREMHDLLAHTIAVISVQAGVADEALADGPEETRAALQTIRAKSRQAMAEIRATVGVLREGREGAPTSPSPSLAQLPALVGTAVGPDVRVDVTVSGAARPLPAVVDLTAYRIVQESLTNVLRHARATVAKVSIGFEPDAVVVEVDNDGRAAGKGLPALIQDGHGLAGMRERAAALGGHFEAGPTGGGGFRVRAWLPTERVA
jgi:signal transduction histidine kinase